ncbi:uncharacterized protein TIAM1-AS1 isoform X1 [Macaca nemestrina]|uniref:uncharacterized protein TIAM1-AS1 isoform X1 n=1 Tax=Macaca nemestrina TaxID=9545 RepID=UPI0039B92B09
MPSCEAPTAGTGEISRRQRRCGGPGDDQGAPNKAALGGLEASASLGDRSAKLPVTPHRWRWPMACTDGARVGARARLGIGGIGRRSQLGRQGIYAVGVAELLLCSTCSYRPREASCTLSRGTFQRMLQSVASSYNLCIAPSNGKGQPRYEESPLLPNTL